MSRLIPGHRGRLARLADQDWWSRPASRRSEALASTPGWLVAGLVAAGVGALAWYYVGPDVKRYIKLRNM